VPLYEYQCKSCNATFEQLVFNSDEAVKCRKCGSTDIARLLSVFAVAGTSERTSFEEGPCGSCGAAQRGACMMDN
jgi:putative FmdB family regulatory protein